MGELIFKIYILLPIEGEISASHFVSTKDLVHLSD